MKYETIKQKGFSAVMAIVVIVLLSLIGTYMATMTTTSALNTTSSYLGIQSWFAARSAIEWAVHTAVNQSCTCGTNCCSNIDGTNISFGSGGLNGFSANFDGTTGCTETSLREGGSDYCVYNVDVLGAHGSPGEMTYASRRIKISIADRNAP